MNNFLKELEYIRVKIRFETLNKLKLKCRNLYVKKNKIVICSSRSKAMGHPTEESHSSIQTTCNLYNFHYTTTRRWESNDEQRNHKLQARKYMNFFCYKNENSKFMECKYHKSYQNKLVCFLGQPNLCSSLSMEANHQWEQCTQDSSKDFDYQSQMAENYNGPSKSKGKRVRERMRAWAREWVWVCFFV